MSYRELCESISFDLTDKYFLVTYHPITNLKGDKDEAIENLLAALDDYPDYKLLITKPNADTGGRAVINILEEYAAKNPHRVSLHANLGQVRYLSAVKYAKAVVGNSSSGIIEVPFLKVPTVNIGARQDGRLMASSIVCCSEDEKSIADALKLALSTDFQDKLLASKMPYGSGNTSKMIKDKLKEVDLKSILSKKFYDFK